RLLARNQGEHDELAVFGGAEQHLARVVIFGELLRRGRRSFAGLGTIDENVFDRALLILVAIGGSKQGLGRVHAGSNRATELTPQQATALLLDETSFRVARVADDLLETETIELTVRAKEHGVGGDLLGHF